MSNNTHHENLFEAVDDRGILVVLRIPMESDMGCEKKLWARQVGIDKNYEPVTMIATDLEAADWLFIDPSCKEDPDIFECMCRLVSLTNAVEYLDNIQRARAVIAHMQSMVQVIEHRRCISVMLLPPPLEELDNDLHMGHEDLVEEMRRALSEHREDLDMGLQSACSECITDPYGHSEALSDVVETKTQELFEFLAIYKMEIEIKGKREDCN